MPGALSCRGRQGTRRRSIRAVLGVGTSTLRSQETVARGGNHLGEREREVRLPADRGNPGKGVGVGCSTIRVTGPQESCVLDKPDTNGDSGGRGRQSGKRHWAAGE